MGMTDRQLLWLVQLPLALPSIISGIRVATVIGVGTTTIAAAIGAGGLGEYIFRGLSMVDTTTILAGAVPAAVLALAADGLLGWMERRARTARITTRCGCARRCGGVAAPRRTGCRCLCAAWRRGRGRRLEELHRAGDSWRAVAQAIEAEGGVRVERKLNLGGTFVARPRRSHRRARRLCRVHRHRGDGRVPRAGAARLDRRSRAGACTLCAARPDGGCTARVQQHVRHSGQKRRRDALSACRPSTI